MSKSHGLGVIATRKIFSDLFSFGPNFDPPTPPLTPGGFFLTFLLAKIFPPPPHTHTHTPLPRGDFFQNRMVFLPGSEGSSPPKMKLIGSIFSYISLPMHGQGLINI